MTAQDSGPRAGEAASEVTGTTRDSATSSRASKPVLLDLFCRAGGATRGYQQAGFYVVGVDIDPQPDYCGDEFVQADALDLLRHGWVNVVAIHASPPCQGYSTQTQHQDRHERLIEPVRALLERTGLPYVIENVEGARKHLIDPVRLCGSSFGLEPAPAPLLRDQLGARGQALRPRMADTEVPQPRHEHLVRAGRLASVVGVHGHINYEGEFPLRCAAMGIDWMTNDDLVEAIPPAYTEYIGSQLLAHLRSEVAA